jgi:hypothetical protein
VLPDPDEDFARVLEETNRFNLCEYSDKDNNQPEFLINTDYYFVKPDLTQISQDVLELISDSEVQTKQTQEELDHKQHTKTSHQLDNMLKQMNAMN